MGKRRIFELVMVAALTAFPLAHAGPAAVVEDQRITLKVEGLTCSSCERQAGQALKKVRGVKEAVVSAKEGRAEITFDSTAAKAQDLVNAIHDAGYKASLPDSSTGG